jgi:hypothetical protein
MAQLYAKQGKNENVHNASITLHENAKQPASTYEAVLLLLLLAL